MTRIERRLAVGVAPRRLEAALALPPGTPRAAAVVCHPHPEYGGDMDNAVVVAVADALVQSGMAALRFNFGGVGASGGRYGGGPAEVDDVKAALAALRAEVPGVPAIVAGYSFGSWVGTQAAIDDGSVARVVAVAPPVAFFDWSFAASLVAPLAVVVGDRDQFCPLSRLDTLGLAMHRIVVPGADHFFAGRQDDVAAAIRDLVE